MRLSNHRNGPEGLRMHVTAFGRAGIVVATGVSGAGGRCPQVVDQGYTQPVILHAILLERKRVV